ncbi:MAG: DUF1624 domain-containing protein [Bacilli bacterium]|nr:DUF1624 domain-containing protein [Bacilli bacterium]
MQEAEEKVLLKEDDEKTKKKKRRVWEVDFLRGFSIFMMFLDHFLYDVKTIPYYFSNAASVNNAFFNGLVDLSRWFSSGIRTPLHILFVAIFFSLSGISCTFSKNNFIHALKIFIGAALISGATFLLFYISGQLGMEIDERIIFGVLVQLGLGVLLVAFICLIPKKPIRLALYLSIGTILVTLGFVFGIYSGEKTIWLYSFPTWEDVPALLWGSKGWGGDYFSTLWVGWTLLGAFIGETLYAKRKSILPALDRGWHKPMTWLGRNALWAYLLHQPIVLGLLVGLCLLLGYRF